MFILEQKSVPYRSHKGASDFYTGRQRSHDILTIPAWSLYGFLLVRCRNMTKKSHDGYMKCKHSRNRPQPVWKYRGIKNHTALLAKIVSMNRNIHNLKPQITTWYREEEPLNHHETPGRQIKQSNQLSLPHQDDCNTRMDKK